MTALADLGFHCLPIARPFAGEWCLALCVIEGGQGAEEEAIVDFLSVDVSNRTKALEASLRFCSVTNRSKKLFELGCDAHSEIHIATGSIWTETPYRVTVDDEPVR